MVNVKSYERRITQNINSYKGFKVEKLSTNDYVVYFSDKFGDNTVLSNIEELKKYVDSKIKRDLENKLYNERINKEKLEREHIINIKRKHLNNYLLTIRDSFKRGRTESLLLKNERYLYLEKLAQKIVKLNVGTKDAIKFNRRKYNYGFDNQEEQNAYAKRANEQVVAYQAWTSDNSFYYLKLFEFNYVKYLKELN
jgi:hypothetical protein